MSDDLDVRRTQARTILILSVLLGLGFLIIVALLVIGYFVFVAPFNFD